MNDQPFSMTVEQIYRHEREYAIRVRRIPPTIAEIGATELAKKRFGSAKLTPIGIDAAGRIQYRSNIYRDKQLPLFA